MAISEVNEVSPSLSAEEIITPSDDHVRSLLKSIEAAFTIECVPCGNTDTVQASSEWAASMLLAQGGWCVVENEAWCTECVESDGVPERETDTTTTR